MGDLAAAESAVIEATACVARARRALYGMYVAVTLFVLALVCLFLVGPRVCLILDGVAVPVFAVSLWRVAQCNRRGWAALRQRRDAVRAEAAGQPSGERH